MKDFRRLKVWEKAHLLALGVYRTTAEFPRQEAYGLTAQLRRASVSVPANIAEACGRRGNKEMAKFLQIGMGSASEMEYELLLARELGYLEDSAYLGLQAGVTELERMLASLLRKVRADDGASRARS